MTEREMPNELRECPWCGRKGELRSPKIHDKIEYKVKCPNLWCHIQPETELCDNEEEAIEQWNRRADNG